MPATPNTQAANDCGSPPALLAIIRAARKTGDRQLERNARRELADRYGIEVCFRREASQEVPR